MKCKAVLRLNVLNGKVLLPMVNTQLARDIKSTWMFMINQKMQVTFLLSSEEEESDNRDNSIEKH